LIEASDLTKRFGAFTAVDHVGFQVDRGRVAGFLGLNGAGKTTTMRIVSCYMPQTSGRVQVAGFDTVRQSEEVRRRIGYLPEQVPLYDDLRVTEYLRYRASLKGVRGAQAKEAVSRVIGQCGLDVKRKSIVGTLSKGYRQRVGVADALVHGPELLLLDEPTSGLDPDQRIELRGLIRELGAERTVLLSTHILPEAEAVCDDVIIIHRGQIRAADRLDKLRSDRRPDTRIRHGGPPLDSYGVASDLVRIERGDAEAQPTTLFVSPKGDASSVVGHIAGAGRPVLEMAEMPVSLERIFMGLTTGREEVA